MLVFELLKGGNLKDYMKNNPFYEKYAAKIMACLIASVAYIHSYNIVHRDIKPDNILFKQ
jgi:serine/threonine protein kinase